MTTKQKRAIWYSDRERKLNKLESLGLMKEYREFCKGKNNQIALFCNRKGIRL